MRIAPSFWHHLCSLENKIGAESATCEGAIPCRRIASRKDPEAALQPMYGLAYEVHELAKARSSLGGGTSVFALKKDKGATSAHHPRITHQDSGE